MNKLDYSKPWSDFRRCRRLQNYAILANKIATKIITTVDWSFIDTRTRAWDDSRIVANLPPHRWF